MSHTNIPALFGTLSSMNKAIEANQGAKAFRLCSKTSPKTIALLLSRTKAKRLVVSPSINSSMALNVKSALKRVGVKLVVEKNPAGRLKSRSVISRFRKARQLVNRGMDVYKACEKIGISRRTYYHVLKSAGNKIST